MGAAFGVVFVLIGLLIGAGFLLLRLR